MRRIPLILLLVSNGALAGVIDTIPLQPLPVTIIHPDRFILRCRPFRTFKAQPLYIVDGVQHDSFDLKNFDPPYFSQISFPKINCSIKIAYE